MRIILDTGAFFRPAALKKARDSRHRVIVPVVAYAERLRQVSAQGAARASRFKELFRPMVEAFDTEAAHRRVPALHAIPQDRWRRLARDAFIAGHVRPGDELWTTDPDDFVAVGVPKDQIVAC
jgi:predicted nucleic acid-binding protein